MKSLFYIIVATALVTILPFLATFENGQDLVRGLLEYGVFAVLLFYVALKGRGSFRRKIILTIAFYAMLVFFAWIDLLTILAKKNWTIGFYSVMPFVGSLFALLLLKNTKRLSLNRVSVVLFVALFVHFCASRIFPSQPLFQFSLFNYLSNQAQAVDRTKISESLYFNYKITDSAFVTKFYVDASRSNVVILVESWGIPMDSIKLSKELAVFKGLIRDKGIHHRMYSRTRTAEREDLLDSIVRDSIGRRDSLFMPKRFAELGYNTTFLFGGDSAIQWRYKYIKNVGFQNAIWMDSATADFVMMAKIDSLLNQPDSTKQFIAWTTRDTRFPISNDPVETEKLYYERLFGTLRLVADLAKMHPDVRFIVQGDHEPILSPLEFQASFYRRWVPYVILN